MILKDFPMLSNCYVVFVVNAMKLDTCTSGPLVCMRLVRPTSTYDYRENGIKYALENISDLRLDWVDFVKLMIPFSRPAIMF